MSKKIVSYQLEEIEEGKFIITATVHDKLFGFIRNIRRECPYQNMMCSHEVPWTLSLCRTQVPKTKEELEPILGILKQRI